MLELARWRGAMAGYGVASSVTCTPETEVVWIADMEEMLTVT